MSAESQAISHNISLLLTAGRSAEARAELERLMALDADDPDARSLAGDVYAYTGAHSAAYKQYNLSAETYNRLGRADMALAVHHKILELDPGMLDAATQTRIRLLALLVAAEDAVVMGHNDKAVAGFQEAIRQFPNHTITYQRLASLLVRLGRVEDAAAQYLVVARAFYAHGVLAKARPYFERVLELKPDHAEGLGSLLACLRQEGKDGEGERFVKAAAVSHLQAGQNEEAAALFESLPEAQRAGASALGAALLLQSGEVGQAERMAGQLELARPELQDWFKRLGRSALERGDSVAADAYFRWAQGQAQADAPVNPMPVLLNPVAAAEPEPEPDAVAQAQPEPVAVAPLPATAVASAPRVPAAALTPPMPAAPPLAPPAPPAGQGRPPLPPPGLGAPPAPMAAPAPKPVVMAPAAPAAAMSEARAEGAATSGEDQGILQTMGEMCLAEEMFEEAKQVFERLSKAQPDNPVYWELLNRSRAGLGLSPVMPPRSAAPAPSIASPVTAPAPTPVITPSAAAPAPEPVVATPLAQPAPVEAPVVPPAPPPVFAPPAVAPAMEAPPILAPPLLPGLAAAAAPSAPAIPWLPGLSPIPGGDAAVPEAAAPEPAAETAAPELAPVEPPLPAAIAPLPLPAPALPPMAPPPPKPVGLPAAAIAFKPVVLPQRPLAPKAAAPKPMAMAAPGSARIERAAYTMQLGELPPAVPSAVDDNDEIIE